MQMPPNALDGIQVRRVSLQNVDHDTVAVQDQVFVNRAAVTILDIVADRMNLPVTP